MILMRDEAFFLQNIYVEKKYPPSVRYIDRYCIVANYKEGMATTDMRPFAGEGDMMDSSSTGKTECDEESTNEYSAGDSGYFASPRPGLRLYFYGGSYDNTWVEVESQGDYLFGRSKDSSFRFSDSNRTDAKVSRKHALLRVNDQSVTLVNQTPQNGLILNGVVLADYQEVVLNDTDVITLGGRGPSIRVRIGDLNVLPSTPDSHGEQHAERK